jgi:hypothetical protein
MRRTFEARSSVPLRTYWLKSGDVRELGAAKKQVLMIIDHLPSTGIKKVNWF